MPVKKFQEEGFVVKPAGVVQVHLLLAPLQTELAAAEELEQLGVI